MQEKIELNRVRTFSEIIEDSIQFFKQNWKPLLRSYFAICGFFCVAGLVIGILNEKATLEHAARGESVFGLTYFLSIGYGLINHLVIMLTVYSFIALYKEKGNEAPNVEEVWSYVKYFFFRIFGSYLCLVALILAGVVCCIIPGIYFSIVFTLTFPIIIMENATLGYAFNRSFQLIKNNWWLTFGVALVLGIIIFADMFAVIIPVGLVTVAASFLSLVNTAGIYGYAFIITSGIFQFLYLLPLIGIALTYFSLTEGKDDGTLYERIMLIGKNNTNTIDPLTEEY
jgi:hypothetical protein